MALTYQGNITLQAAMPGVYAGFQAGITGIGAALPDIEARLAALAAFAPQVEVSFTAQITLAQSIIASLQAAIAAGLTPPTISAQISIVAALVAALEVTLGGINASLEVVIDLSALLDAAGVFCYTYTGTASGLGTAMQSELVSGFPGAGGASQAAFAVVLATVTPGTWDAMSGLLKTE